MARFTVQNLSTLSLLASFTAASSSLSDEFLNNGHTVVYVKNSGIANAITVASRFSPVPKGLAVANITIDVSAAGEKLCGFFDQSAYNDSSGCVTLSYTTHTGLTVAIISVT